MQPIETLSMTVIDTNIVDRYSGDAANWNEQYMIVDIIQLTGILAMQPIETRLLCDIRYPEVDRYSGDAANWNHHIFPFLSV